MIDPAPRYRLSHLARAETGVVAQSIYCNRVLRIDGVDEEAHLVAGVDAGRGRIAFDFVLDGYIGQQPARGARILIFALDRVGGLREKR